MNNAKLAIKGKTHSIHPSIYLSTHPFIQPAAHPSLPPFTHLSIPPSIHPSIHLPICPQFIHPCILHTPTHPLTHHSSNHPPACPLGTHWNMLVVILADTYMKNQSEPQKIYRQIGRRNIQVITIRYKIRCRWHSIASPLQKKICLGVSKSSAEKTHFVLEY